jgi:hypothetical protein
LFASLMAASDGCIIKLDCLPRASGLILQLHKAVIDRSVFDGARHGETDQL